jgi:hypothetical protein
MIDWMGIVEKVVYPIIAGFLGWIYSKYRTRQEREKSILDNVQVVIDMLSTQLTKMEETQKKSDNINQRLEAKLDRKNKSIRQANKCPYTTQGDGCPVLAQEEKNEHCYDLDCQKCEHHNPKCDD